ncbi:uncharacterized protein BKA55DRAFT_605618 [Fusarium redolens]|uniref:Uncharacterized protein n=1 Tax=Fusarium redolens TaxID=48865 RepID=A0A9P9KS84_FUSRE|nr:uncharacterized protein BKA55DRAFT_605618 [Fusarium redolens]KAH7267537.1 hypothetical protein BKA55DRAFT_605618 [Fusarium redolens]
MTISSDQVLDSKTVFPHSYREGVKCIGFSKSQGRPCNRVIGAAKVREHEHLMSRLNSVPLEQRADHPRLEEAVRLLLCFTHKHADFDTELEDASQKFRDAAEAAKEAEAARVKWEKHTPQKRPGILRKRAVQFVTPSPLPVTRRGVDLGEASAANSGKSGHRLQASDIPSESESDSEGDGSDDDDIHPLKAWRRYKSKWEALEKSGLEKGVSIVQQVPWPVASGKHQDVSKEAVLDFFNNVAGDPDNADRGVMFSRERMRWRSSNVKDTFGREVYRGIMKREMKMISSVAKVYEKRYSE